MVEFGHAKVDTGAPIVNLAIGYDTKNREPLFYEEYPGSTTDVSQLEIMVKGMASFISELICEYMGSFEKKRNYDIDDYGLHGKTAKAKLYDSDDKETGKFVYAEEKVSITEREISLCGYFVLVTSEKMTEDIIKYQASEISNELKNQKGTK